MHHGQETSETKSILMGLVIVAPHWRVVSVPYRTPLPVAYGNRDSPHPKQTAECPLSTHSERQRRGHLKSVVVIAAIANRTYYVTRGGVIFGMISMTN